MVTLALMAAIVAMPFLLSIMGLKTLAILGGIFVALCVPSMAYVLYLAVRNRTLPRITGGPSIMWAGKHYSGKCNDKSDR
jgi:hypothetical protein